MRRARDGTCMLVERETERGVGRRRFRGPRISQRLLAPARRHNGIGENLWGLGFGVWGLGFWGLGCWAQGLGFGE